MRSQHRTTATSEAETGSRRPGADSCDPLADLAPVWLSFSQVAERLGTDEHGVRRLVRDHDLLAVRCGRPRVPRVPELLLDGDRPLPELRGTLTVLADSGFGDLEALRWLLTEDDSLPGTPAAALKAGRKTEIRRRAQALAF